MYWKKKYNNIVTETYWTDTWKMFETTNQYNLLRMIGVVIFKSSYVVYKQTVFFNQRYFGPLEIFGNYVR